jgi:hypothetical protein
VNKIETVEAVVAETNAVVPVSDSIRSVLVRDLAPVAERLAHYEEAALMPVVNRQDAEQAALVCEEIAVDIKAVKAKAAPAAKKIALASGKFKCKQCGKEFVRAIGSHRETCSQECLTMFNREYAKRKYHEYKAKKDATAPATPAMSADEFKAKRIAAIKAAVEKAG